MSMTWHSLGSVASAAWRVAGAALPRRPLTTSAPLQRRFPRAKLPLNTERLAKSERLTVAVSRRPDVSRGALMEDGGIQYHGFRYYPRVPGQEDEPVTPAKLHRIQLTAPLKGEPYWVKDTCRQLGIHAVRSTLTTGAVAVVKNIPEMNALLWRVKHVVRVDPVTFPDGAPSTDDLDGWQLLEDGRVVRNAMLRVQQAPPPADQHLKVSRQTIKDRMRLRWIKPFHLDDKRTV